MFSNTTIWKRFSYTLWAPVYDLIVKPLFGRKRQRSIELLDLKAGECVLSRRGRTVVNCAHRQIARPDQD